MALNLVHNGDETRRPIDIARELQSRYAACMDPNTRPSEGELCRERENMGFMNGRPVLILWTMLDGNSPIDQMIVSKWIEAQDHPISDVNCMVLWVCSEGHSHFIPHDVALLEVYHAPADERSN